MKTVRIGSLRHRISIQQGVATANGFGEPIITWTEFASRWASVEPLIGNEEFRAKQISAELSHRIRMRHMDGLTPKMRIIFDGRTFDIYSIANIEERDYQLEILASQRP